MTRMGTSMATWLTTNEKVKDGVLRQKGMEEEDKYNLGYLAVYQ